MTRNERLQSRRRIRTRGEMPKDEDRIFRDELGFAMSGTQYGEFQEGEAEYTSKYDELMGEVKTANKALTDAEKKVHGVSIDKEYNKAKEGWIKVNVMNGFEKEGTYYMPKDMVDQLNTDSFNQEEPGAFVGSWGLGGDKEAGKYTDPEQYYVDVRPKGMNNPMGKELHESMIEAETQLKTEYYKKLNPEIDAAKATALGDLRSQRDIVEGERDLLVESKGQRDTMKADAKGDYEEKKTTRGRALAGAIS